VLGASLMACLMCSYTQDPGSAEELFAEAIACTRRSGDHFIAYHLHNSLGAHALVLGDIPAARTHLEAAAQEFREVGGEAAHLMSINLGWVLRVERDLGAAQSMFAEGLRTSLRTGQRMGIAYASLGLACLTADQGDWDQAAVLHGVAQTFLDSSREPWQEPESGYRRDSLDQIRAHLGNDPFEQSYAQGVMLSCDEALDLVRGRARAA
jgi:hypothetical protein